MRWKVLEVVGSRFLFPTSSNKKTDKIIYNYLIYSIVGNVGSVGSQKPHFD